jgi:hypothetical protein
MLNKKFWEELIAYDTGHIENDASNNSSIFACVFVTAVTFLRSRCLVTIGETITEPSSSNDKGIFTELLPSNDRGICIKPWPSKDKGNFTEPLPSSDKGDTQTHTYTHRQQRDLISLLSFFQNKESKLKIPV